MANERPPTVFECAAIANNCYASEGNIGPWQRFGPAEFADDGFYAAAYLNEPSKQVIIGIRGTQEGQDIADDLYMVPVIEGNQARQATLKLVVAYLRGARMDGAIHNVAELAYKAFQSKKVRGAAGRWANRIPPGQSTAGLRYTRNVLALCKSNDYQVVGMAGHSLGGAMVQYLCQQTGSSGELGGYAIPGVAFNSPYMGSIKGTRQGQGGGILIVNCRLDPLSMMTRGAGNASHATLGSESLEPIPMNPPPPRIPDRPTIQQLRDFIFWLGKAMKHYHSMPNMVNLVSSARCANTLLK